MQGELSFFQLVVFIFIPLILITAIAFWPVAYNHLDKLLLLYIVLAPFHTIVRGINVGSVLLSGWRDLLFIGLVSLWLFGLFLGRFRIRSIPLVLTILMFNIFGILQIARADSLVIGISGFRDIIKYSLLGLITYSLCLEQPALLRRIVVTIFVMGVVVTAFQSIFYFMNIDYLLRLGTAEPTYRAIGPFYLRRMEAFFGGGPSNLGIYFGVPLVIYLILQQLGQKIPRWWHVGALLLFFGLFMTLSFTAIVAVGAIYALFLLRRGGNMLFKVVALAVLVVVFTGLNISFGRAVVNDQEATDFLSYFFNIFFKGLFLENLVTLFEEPSTLLIGRGLALVGAKQFLGETLLSDTMIIGNSDGGWVEFAIQVGLLMTLLILTTIVLTCLNAFKKAKLLPPSQRVITWALIGAMVVMLSSIHIVPWTRVGLDVNFWIVLGALASVPALARKPRFVDYQVYGTLVPSP